jgi:hypothetical protein
LSLPSRAARFPQRTMQPSPAPFALSFDAVLPNDRATQPAEDCGLNNKQEDVRG